MKPTSFFDLRYHKAVVFLSNKVNPGVGYKRVILLLQKGVQLVLYVFSTDTNKTNNVIRTAIKSKL